MGDIEKHKASTRTTNITTNKYLDDGGTLTTTYMTDENDVMIKESYSEG